MKYNVKVVKSRRKSLGLQIKNFGEVIVRAPIGTSDDDIRRVLDEKSSWIDSAFKKIQHRDKELEGIEPISEEEIKELTKIAKQVIPKITEEIAAKMGVTYDKITIRHQRTRWGSCSSKGNLNFNCLLMKAPPRVLQYVIVHELAHRIEMNHSSRFWKIVETVMPDYKICKTWLKVEGSKLIVPKE